MAKSKEVTVTYGGGHHSSKTYVKDESFCPNCGKAEVWRADDYGGDYYVGETHVCTECSYRFHLPCSGLNHDYVDQIVAQLKESDGKE